MSAVELRERLIERIRETNDKSMLEEAYRLLDPEVNEVSIYNFSDDEKTEIESIRLKIRQGQFLTDDRANQEIDEWLNKKCGRTKPR